jgi:predicted SPOUT superfamily RNA methylase MTH1
MSSPSTTSIASPSLSLAIPSSFIEVSKTLAQQTIQIGRIGRAAAIFRVDEILVYADQLNRAEAAHRRLVTSVLEYMETPQYLRKYLFAKQPELRYVGLLPPLRTPHHPIEKRAQALRDGEIREGYGFRRRGRAFVDVGVERPLPLRGSPPSDLPGRVTVRIERSDQETLATSLAPPSSAGEYWGFRVTETQRPLGEFIPRIFADSLVVATSRKGMPIRDVWMGLKTRWRDAKRVLTLFGSHAEGLAEIAHRQGHELTSFVHYVVNTIPNQGVATVRTDEAVMLSLPVFRLLEIL